MVFNYSQAVGIWGVRFFFVISGFLITHLLVQEQVKHGCISLKNFYVRRAIRILPVCFFYLLVLGLFTRYSQDPALWLANLTFTTNFVKILHPIPTGHLWSLGVEEQFYLLWPCLLVALFRRAQAGPRRLNILIVPLLIAPAVRMAHYQQWYPEPLEFLFLDGSFFQRLTRWPMAAWRRFCSTTGEAPWKHLANNISTPLPGRASCLFFHPGFCRFTGVSGPASIPCRPRIQPPVAAKPPSSRTRILSLLELEMGDPRRNFVLLNLYLAANVLRHG